MTAQAFAGASGVNAGTLRHWKYRLRRPVPPSAAAEGQRSGSTLRWPLVEVIGAPVPDARFELELARGRRVRVPASFDAEALRRLLVLLEEGTEA